MVAATMAKKKRPAPKAEDRRSIVITIKGSLEWKAWVDELADQFRTDASKLIDMALVQFAKANGFTKEAPRR